MPELKACERCLTQAGLKALDVAEADRAEVLRAGRRAMRIAANIALSIAPPPKAIVRKCMHCSDPVVPAADGTAALWCTACEEDRRQYGSPEQPSLEVVN